LRIYTSNFSFFLRWVNPIRRIRSSIYGEINRDAPIYNLSSSYPNEHALDKMDRDDVIKEGYEPIQRLFEESPQ
jgi:hypothetical protein|tara:strand:+ start:5698 stop:5919 length:222 start_codon:yes stop_codon:yes gene_type:complete